MAALAPYAGRATVIGLTGAPGVGKSTTTSALVTAYRALGKRVAVLAVDPSSPFSGGALLGDRVRMQDHALDPDVYIRSMASRGHLGGLSWSTPQALRVLDAAGCDVVLVETVGVGPVRGRGRGRGRHAPSCCSPPGWATRSRPPRPASSRSATSTSSTRPTGTAPTPRCASCGTCSRLGERRAPGDWRPPIVKTVASRGEGIDELVEALDKHRGWLEETGDAARAAAAPRGRRGARRIALTALRERVGDLRGQGGEHGLDELAGRRWSPAGTDPYAAADRPARPALDRAAEPAGRGSAVPGGRRRVAARSGRRSGRSGSGRRSAA